MTITDNVGKDKVYFLKKLIVMKNPLGTRNRLFVVSFSNIVIFRLKLKTIKPCSIEKITLRTSYLLTHPDFYVFLLLLKVWVIDKLCTYVSFDKVTVIIRSQSMM
jgi:hypothetical protein